jgi:12,18-didecarboxysiroheme deacetylase
LCYLKGRFLNAIQGRHTIMIGISKLYCGAVEASDALRYGRQSGKLPSHLLQFSVDKKPVVVWNMTKRCNLKCVHCYAKAVDPEGTDQISTTQAKAMIDDLAAFGAPVMLFSGGEPLVRKDLVELAQYATGKGMRAVISTNGTLITKDKARELKSVGLSYVGISLDGGEAVHDLFRAVPGAFKKALQGVENCQAEGLKVGLRFTINKRNAAEIPEIFRIVKEMDIPRVCFYHLVYSGRGSELIKEDLDHAETRAAVDLIMDETRALFDAGKPKEVLTVDNHADGPHVYFRLLKEDPKRAAEVMELLQMNEGNSTGRGIGCISWDGQVHADQFWRNHTFGNVLERPFSQIWDDPNIELLHKLKDKKPHVKGRCATCRFLNICGGNFRARAEAYYGDIWAQDPACYLTDEEIKG